MWSSIEPIIHSEPVRIAFVVPFQLLFMFQFYYTGFLCVGLWMLTFFEATVDVLKHELWCCVVNAIPGSLRVPFLVIIYTHKFVLVVVSISTIL